MQLYIFFSNNAALTRLPQWFCFDLIFLLHSASRGSTGYQHTFLRASQMMLVNTVEKHTGSPLCPLADRKGFCPHLQIYKLATLGLLVLFLWSGIHLWNKTYPNKICTQTNLQQHTSFLLNNKFYMKNMMRMHAFVTK